MAIDNPFDNMFPNVGETIEIGQLPALLANPAILQIAQNAANIVGDTLEQFVQHYTDAIKTCEDTCVNCYGKVSDVIQKQYDNATTDFHNTVDQLYTALCHLASSINSGAVNTINQTCITLENAIASIPKNEYAIIYNCIPDRSSWTNPLVPYDSWFPDYLSYYWVNSNGQILEGARLNKDNSYTLATQQTFPVAPESLGQMENIITQEANDPNSLANSVTANIKTFQCTDICMDESNQPILTSPVTTPIVQQLTPIANPVLNTGNTVAPVVSSVTSGQIPNVSNVTNVSNITNESNSCPTPVVNISVPTPSVTVNVAPCSNVATTQDKAKRTGRGSKEEVTVAPNDLIKETLLAMGFPDSFVELFASSVEQEESQFEDSTLTEDISTLQVEMIT